MLASLRSAGIEVVECHESLWYGIEDRVNTVSGGWLKPKFWLRLIKTYSRLLRKYRKVGEYDVLMVGYPGHFDVFLANWLRKKRKKPLVWDVLMSLYLVSKERKLDKKNSFIVKLIKTIEGSSLKQADLMLIESEHYAGWFNTTYGVPLDRFAYLALGVDEAVFNPDRCKKLPKNEFPVNVFFYGGFLPSHGTEIIVEAARVLLTDHNIQFELAGTGPEMETARKNSADLNNVTFTGFLTQEDLLDRICAADICLGVFGNTLQAMMTVQNKLFECLAMGKCVVSGESKAVRNVFTHEKEIWLCERTTIGLVQAISKLAYEPSLRVSLGTKAAQRVKQCYSFQSLGSKLKEDLEGLVNAGGIRINLGEHTKEIIR